jgi:DNA-binding HxlR family transcriptional regulator
MAQADDLREDELCKRAFVVAIKDAVNVVSGKWKLAIVCTLLTGPKGFAEIERLLGGISPRMLTRDLRELELSGVIAREQTLENASAGRKYMLTESGKALESLILQMAQWGREHRQRPAV